jgi:hypothetical protein
MMVKVPLPAVNFLLSQTYLLVNLPYSLSMIQEDELTIMTCKTIKGHYLSLHLVQNVEISEEIDEKNSSLSTLFYINNQILPVVEHPWYKYMVCYLQKK